MPQTYKTDFKVGDHNIRPFGTDIHNPVFLISTILILIFVIGTLAAPEAAKSSFDGAKAWSINGFDWLFMVAGNIFVKMALHRWHDGRGDFFVWIDALIVLMAASLALLVLWAHRANIGRLRRGEEPRIGRKRAG